ncbi:MAG: DUF933 domain-containing protein [Bacillota bacterium]
MKVGITGNPQVGKTTLFRLLTGSSPGSSLSKVGVMEVPDERLPQLSRIFERPKSTYARIDLVDIMHHRGQDLLNEVRNLDAVVIVVGAFIGEEEVKESLDFVDSLVTDFYVADLVSVENRLEKLQSKKTKPVNQMEIPFLMKCKRALDEDLLLKEVEFAPHEIDFLSSFSFYTLKPIILAVNLSEEQLLSGTYPGMKDVRELADAQGYEVVRFSGVLEEEISALSPEDGSLFLQEFGLEESGIARLAKVTYSALGLITFFTVSADEVRAWSIPKGTTVKEAAGKIHTDLERGFIRADVVSYQDLISAGSLKASKEKGLLRVEGKEYIVQDGDVINVRFNV